MGEYKMNDEKNFINVNQLKQELESYKKFAFSNNLIALALSLTMANATEKIIHSISENVLMPIINYFVDNAGENWRNLVFVPITGLEFEIGSMINGFLKFIFTSIIVYIFYTKVFKKNANISMDE
jgi:large-conductance mechanosensitive channel